jgi:hypothetical protein
MVKPVLILRTNSQLSVIQGITGVVPTGYSVFQNPEELWTNLARRLASSATTADVFVSLSATSGSHDATPSLACKADNAADYGFSDPGEAEPSVSEIVGAPVRTYS